MKKISISLKTNGTPYPDYIIETNTDITDKVLITMLKNAVHSIEEKINLSKGINKNRYTIYPEINNIIEENRTIYTDKPYWIVSGAIGIGKTVYIEAMRLKMPNMQFLEVQRLEIIPNRIKVGAKKIITLREVYM